MGVGESHFTSFRSQISRKLTFDSQTLIRIIYLLSDKFNQKVGYSKENSYFCSKFNLSEYDVRTNI